MIFRLTQKLAMKVGLPLPQSLPLDPNPLADWSANLFTADRVQYLIVTNTASLYSFLMYGRGITDDNKFVQRVLSSMRDFMIADGNEFLFRRFISPRTDMASFSKTANRSVLGNMNDLVFLAKFLLVEDEMSPVDTSVRLNEAPMSCLEFRSPRKAFKSLRIPEANAFDSGTERSGGG